MIVEKVLQVVFACVFADDHNFEFVNVMKFCFQTFAYQCVYCKRKVIVFLQAYDFAFLSRLSCEILASMFKIIIRYFCFAYGHRPFDFV